MGRCRSLGGATSGDGELTMEEGDYGSISEEEEVGRNEETQGEGEERGGGGEGTKGRGSGKTTRGELPGRGDEAARVIESDGEEKKGESSWTSVRKVYPVAFLCPGFANKYAFESASGKLGQGRRMIPDIQRLKEEGKREARWVGGGEGE